MAEPAGRENRLATVLSRSAERAEQLVTLLEAEHAALTAGAPQAIVAAARAKQAVVDEFEGLGTHLTTALHAVGIDDPRDLESRLAGEPDGPVGANLRRLLAALAECRHANARNGAAIRQLARHNSHLLSLLRGDAPGATLYDHDGRARQGPLTRYATSA